MGIRQGSKLELALHAGAGVIIVREASQKSHGTLVCLAGTRANIVFAQVVLIDFILIHHGSVPPFT